MTTLVSPGISVTVTDESFFIPASAPTVPLIFIATADEKIQPDGVSPAAGTYEHDVIRTVTSASQSVTLYGIPQFLTDTNGNELHGDSRNEYGLFALNQYLGIGNLSYVIRAFVDLDDTRTSILTRWAAKVNDAANVLESLAQARITNFNLANGFYSGHPMEKLTVNATEFLQDAHTAMNGSVYHAYAFRNTGTNFEADWTSNPLNIFSNGYNQPPAVVGFLGLTGVANEWVTLGLGTLIGTEWTPSEAAQTLIDSAADYQYTQEFLNETTLGNDDAARRAAIVQSLQATINSNQDIRSDTYEYNIILCPGYHEVVDELLTLSVDVLEEAMVIGDPPFDMDADEVVTWGDSVSSDRRRSNKLAYYYPHGLASNLDGHDVFIAASGIALRTWAFSDNQAAVWFAPAGTQRGQVTSVSDVGYIDGILGTATTFIPVALNQGQRDNMYKYFTNLNPIANLQGRGILLFGQKTSQNAASAMDRINVSRLLGYIKRQLRKNLVPFLFEPNDQITRNNVKAVVDNFLGDILARRGLFDFATICDDSNNTPDRIDRNELYIDVALKPTRAVEFIYVPIRILATGADLP